MDKSQGRTNLDNRKLKRQNERNKQKWLWIGGSIGVAVVLLIVITVVLFFVFTNVRFGSDGRSLLSEQMSAINESKVAPRLWLTDINQSYLEFYEPESNFNRMWFRSKDDPTDPDIYFQFYRESTFTNPYNGIIDQKDPEAKKELYPKADPLAFVGWIRYGGNKWVNVDALQSHTRGFTFTKKVASSPAYDISYEGGFIWKSFGQVNGDGYFQLGTVDTGNSIWMVIDTERKETALLAKDNRNSGNWTVWVFPHPMKVDLLPLPIETNSWEVHATEKFVISATGSVEPTNPPDYDQVSLGSESRYVITCTDTKAASGNFKIYPIGAHIFFITTLDDTPLRNHSASTNLLWAPQYEASLLWFARPIDSEQEKILYKGQKRYGDDSWLSSIEQVY